MVFTKLQYIKKLGKHTSKPQAVAVVVHVTDESVGPAQLQPPAHAQSPAPQTAESLLTQCILCTEKNKVSEHFLWK